MRSTRCYKCGRVHCETCGGTGEVIVQIARRSGRVPYHIDAGAECPDCKDGWRVAESTDDAGLYGYHPASLADGTRVDTFLEDAHILGFDPAILCPHCEKALGI